VIAGGAAKSFTRIEKTIQAEQNRTHQQLTNKQRRRQPHVPVKQYAFVKAAKTPISLEFSNAMRDAMMMIDDTVDDGVIGQQLFVTSSIGCTGSRLKNHAFRTRLKSRIFHKHKTILLTSG
jgi:hypothetical protein